MRQQLQFYLVLLFFLPLFPILYWQGKRLKNSIVKLPEADILKGRIGGDGKPLSILIMGESAFAGVGVSTNQEGIAGNLAKEIHQKTGQPVTWQVIAKSGYNAQKATEELTPQVPQDESFDIIFIGLGANEAFDLALPLHHSHCFGTRFWMS